MAFQPERARELFLDAVQIESREERSAFLDRSCGGDTELRRRVEALIAAHELPESLLDKAAFAIEMPSIDSAATGDSLPIVESSARVIGPYKLLQIIGEGGMGTVYMAEQTHPVRRNVALKLIKAGMDSRQVLARFDAERQALALMDHPNIAKVFDAGTTDTGRPYFVMELVKGIPITKFCDERRLTVRERLELAIPVCQAVQHAHQKAIIHRDLKPSNVLIALYDRKPVPKVIDFGVAKATGPRLTDQTLYTEFGAVVGTLEYMSPEQAELNQLDIDTRSDIYSLGVLLYELLTGSTPLEHKRLKEVLFLEVLRVIREEESQRPSMRLSTTEELPSIAACRHVEPRKLSGLVRGELDWIVMTALEKDRNRRYETANALAADLRRYLDDEPVQACPPSAWYRFRKFARRNRAALMAAVPIGFAMLAGLGMLAVSNVLITREKDQKESAFLRANASAMEANVQRAIAVASERVASQRAENLSWEDYINRVNRAYREVQDDNIARAEDLLLGCSPERRGWEWHYVQRLCRLDRLTLEGNGATVNAVAYSPLGTEIVSGHGRPWDAKATDSGELVMRNAQTGREIRRLLGLKGSVRCVAFSPDGTKVASGSGYSSPDSSRLAQVTLWDAITGRALWNASEPRLPSVISVAFHPGGKFVAAGYKDHHTGISVGEVKVFDVTTGRETVAFPGPDGGPNKLAYHPDGKRLAIAGSERVEIWDIDARAKVRELRGHTRWIYSIAFSPDGKSLATAGWDRSIRLWDWGTGAVLTTIWEEHEDFVNDLAFSPDGRLLVSASGDRSVKLWEIPTGRPMATFHGHSDNVSCVAFRPDGQEIASGGLDCDLKIWNLRTSRPVIFDKHSGYVQRLAFRRDGQRVLSEATDYQTDSRTTPERVERMGWDPLTGDLDRALAGVDFGTHQEEFVLNSAVGTQTTSSPDGKRIARIVVDSAADDSISGRTKKYAWNTVEICDSASGRVIHTLIGHTAIVTGAAFSPNGQRLATSSADRTIKLWDVATGREVFSLLGHSSGVMGLAFSPDGNRIASGGLESTARIWDATPLSAEALRTQEARYRRKVTALVELTQATKDVQRAEVFEKTGRWDLAAAAYSKAIESHPANSKYLLSRSRAYGKLGDLDKAEADVATAVELNERCAPTDPNLLAYQGHSCRILAWEFWRTGHHGKCEKAFRTALQAFETAATQAPDRAGPLHFQSNTLVHLGRVLLSDGRPTEAKDAFDRALAVCENIGAAGLTKGLLSSEVLEHYQDLVYLRSVAGRRKDAVAASERLLELAPKNAIVHNNLAWMLATSPEPKLRDPARAVALAKKGAELAPKEGNHWNTLGAAHYRAGDWKAAIEALTRSMELSNGGDANDWFFLAMAHSQLGDKTQARFWYDKAVPWMEKHQPRNEELVRFRAEAGALLEEKAQKD